MPNRRLTPDEITALNGVQANLVVELEALARGDADLLFAFRRRLYSRLMHMERSTPGERRKLKALKMAEQEGLCAICHKLLPTSGSELDRFDAVKGYTAKNTRLVHHDCHIEDQKKKRFA